MHCCLSREPDAAIESSTAMHICHACKKKIEIAYNVGRTQTCPFCDADLRCCLNCRYYETQAHITSAGNLRRSGCLLKTAQISVIFFLINRQQARRHLPQRGSEKRQIHWMPCLKNKNPRGTLRGLLQLQQEIPNQ